MLAMTKKLIAVSAVMCALAAVAEAAGTASTVVAGMVFCDQCKDGARGLFDYPLYGTVLHSTRQLQELDRGRSMLLRRPT